jgi:hypothetical protein
LWDVVRVFLGFEPGRERLTISPSLLARAEEVIE